MRTDSDLKIENKTAESIFKAGELNLYPMDKDKKPNCFSTKKEPLT